MLLQTGQDLPRGELCRHKLRELQEQTLLCSILVPDAAHAFAFYHAERPQMLGRWSAGSGPPDPLLCKLCADLARSQLLQGRAVFAHHVAELR